MKLSGIPLQVDLLVQGRRQELSVVLKCQQPPWKAVKHPSPKTEVAK